MSLNLCSILVVLFAAQFSDNNPVQYPSETWIAAAETQTATLEESVSASRILSVTPISPEEIVSDLSLSHVWSPYGRPAVRYRYEPNVMAIKGLGFKGLDAFAHWSEVEPLSREEEPRFYIADVQVELATRNQLIPSLTVISSPFQSYPDWFMNGPQAKFLASLDNQTSTPVLSFWNPPLTGHIDRLLGAVASHYGDDLGLLILAPLGDRGEAAYPTGGGAEYVPPATIKA